MSCEDRVRRGGAAREEESAKDGYTQGVGEKNARYTEISIKQKSEGANPPYISDVVLLRRVNACFLKSCVTEVCGNWGERVYAACELAKYV